MKKIILLVVLCMVCSGTWALPPQTVTNTTTLCNVKIVAFCYASPACTPNQTLGLPLLVPASSGPTALPTGTCNVVPGSHIGYKVCCPDGTTCVVVNDGGTVFCSTIGTSAMLTCSADCQGLHIHWDATAGLIVAP